MALFLLAATAALVAEVCRDPEEWLFEDEDEEE